MKVSLRGNHGRACAAWLRAWVWALIAVLPWAGMASAQRQMLGPLHVHHVGLVDFRQGLIEHLRVFVLAPQHAHGLSVLHMRPAGLGVMSDRADMSDGPAVSARLHDHSSPQRHQHGAEDDSVQALDSSAVDTAPSASPLMAGQAQGLPGLRCPVRADPAPSWCAPHRAEFSAPSPLPPPRA